MERTPGVKDSFRGLRKLTKGVKKTKFGQKIYDTVKLVFNL